MLAPTADSHLRGFSALRYPSPPSLRSLAEDNAKLRQLLHEEKQVGMGLEAGRGYRGPGIEVELLLVAVARCMLSMWTGGQ